MLVEDLKNKLLRVTHDSLNHRVLQQTMDPLKGSTAECEMRHGKSGSGDITKKSVFKSPTRLL